MAKRPDSMTPEQFEAHRKEAMAETKRRAAVEANPTDTMLDMQARIEALEKKPAATAKPAAPKKARR